MAFKLKPKGCPICGFPEMQNLDEFGCTTFEICNCCGCQAGYTFDERTTESHIYELRNDWIEDKACAWWGDERYQPNNWEPTKQMKDAGFLN
jgi:hypothetical protein